MRVITASIAAGENGPAAPVLSARAATALPSSSIEADPGATAARRRLIKDEEIFSQGDPTTFFYKVVRGTVRTSKLLSDGRRQIDAFHLPGDIFGLESGEEHHFKAEAVEEVMVMAFRRSSFKSLLHDNPAFADQLMSAMIDNLDRAHDHMVLLGRKRAQEKLAAFLLDMADRLSPADAGPVRFDLPMQRMDIADHLGLTVETVSRVLMQLVRDGFIGLVAAGRTVVLNDRAGLRLLDT